MEHHESVIGELFWTDAGQFLCTDIGARVIVAVMMCDDPSWLNRPPYAVAEIVFDEDDLPACVRTRVELGEDA